MKLFPRIFLAFLLAVCMGVPFMILSYYLLLFLAGKDKVEIAESGSYVFSSLALPVWGWIGCRIAARRKEFSSKSLGICGLGTGIAVALLLFVRYEFVKLTFLEYCQSPQIWLGALLAGGIVAVLLLFQRRFRRSHFWLVLGILPVFTAMLVTKLYPMEYFHLLFIHHFDVVTHSIAMAAHGQHSVHMYGNYPWFLAPVFLLIGLSVRNVSLVLALMFFVTFALLITTMHFSLRNRALTLVSAILLTFYSCFWGIWPNLGFDPYFQYHPIRSFFPVLAVAYVFFCRAPSQKFFFGGGVLAGLALIWNIESGIAVAGGLSFLLLLEWIAQRKEGWNWRLPASFLGPIAVVLPLWYLLYSIQTGIWLNPLRLLLPGLAFIGSASMMPLPSLPADWLAFLLVSAAGVVTGLYSALQHPVAYRRREAGFPALLGVMGIGTFIYYVGRSHEANLLSVLYLTWMLAVWLLDRVLLYCRRNRPRMLWIFLFFPLFLVLGFALIGTGMRVSKIWTRVQHMPLDYLSFRPSAFDEDAEFVRQCAGERAINIWGQFHGVLLTETGLLPAIPNSNQAELRSAESLQELQRQVLESDAPLFLCYGADSAGELSQLPPESIKENYTLIAVGPGRRVLYFEPRTK